MRNVWCAVALAALMLSGSALNAAEKEKKHDDDEKIAIKDLPKAVSDAVAKAVPEGTLVEAEKEIKKGKTIYEVKTKKGDKVFEVKLDDAGAVLSNKEDKEGDDDDDDDDDDKKENEKGEKKAKKVTK